MAIFLMVAVVGAGVAGTSVRQPPSICQTGASYILPARSQRAQSTGPMPIRSVLRQARLMSLWISSRSSGLRPSR